MLSSFWNDFLKEVAKTEKQNPILYSLLKQLEPTELNDKELILRCNNNGVRMYLEKRISSIERLLFEFSKEKSFRIIFFQVGDFAFGVFWNWVSFFIVVQNHDNLPATFQFLFQD